MFRSACLPVLLVAAGFAWFCSPAYAVIVVNGVSSNTNGAYDGLISTTDLIDISQPNLAGPAVSTVTPFGPYTVTGLYNGNATVPAGVSYWHVNPTQVTFTFDTSVNTLGYSISSIRSFNGFSSDAVTYANQTHSIFYSLVGDESNFLPLTTLAYTPFGPSATGAGSSMVDVTESEGFLLTGVAALRFDIPLFVGGTNTTAVYREIDVFGEATAVAPEPSGLALIGLGLFGQLVCRRNRRRQTLA